MDIQYQGINQLHTIQLFIIHICIHLINTCLLLAIEITPNALSLLSTVEVKKKKHSVV